MYIIGYYNHSQKLYYSKRIFGELWEAGQAEPMALAGLDTAHKGVISGPPCYSCALQYPVVVLTKSYLDEHLAQFGTIYG